jgi:hypothetical protein
MLPYHVFICDGQRTGGEPAMEPWIYRLVFIGFVKRKSNLKIPQDRGGGFRLLGCCGSRILCYAKGNFGEMPNALVTAQQQGSRIFFVALGLVSNLNSGQHLIQA